MRGRQGKKDERWKAIKCPINLVNECPSWRGNAGKRGLACVYRSQVQRWSPFSPPPLTRFRGEESSSRTNAVCGSGCWLQTALLTGWTSTTEVTAHILTSVITFAVKQGRVCEGCCWRGLCQLLGQLSGSLAAKCCTQNINQLLGCLCLIFNRINWVQLIEF